MHHNTDSTFIQREPCPECGSRDNLARYSDGHAYCFGCQYYEKGSEDMQVEAVKKEPTHLVSPGVAIALTKRNLTEATTSLWGYTVGEMYNQPVQIAPYYDDTGTLIAQKVRFANKDFKFLGETKKATLFGQQLWRDGGKRIVVTEGEIDAMSVSQAQNNKWPVVSVPNGAQGAKAALSAQLKWLLQFEEIVLLFDNDEHGRPAAQACATLFPPGRCKIATLSKHKDASDALQVRDTAAIMDAIWGAKEFRPDGVVTAGDLRNRVMAEPESGYPWFLGKLNDVTYGRRPSELYALGAGTGVGKSDLLAQQIAFDLTHLQLPVAAFMLEQPPAETIKRVCGKISGKTFHVPDGSWTKAELGEAYDNMTKGPPLYLYDNFGAMEWDVVASTIRFLAHAHGVKLFYLDHLTALVANDERGEKEALEQIMANMAALVMELSITLIFVSHLTTPDGTPHEEGGRVTIRQFKGSRAIGYWSHFMFGLERNQQEEDERLRKVTTFRVLKDRYTGRGTGVTVYMEYDQSIGKLVELDHNPFETSDGTAVFNEDKQGAF